VAQLVEALRYKPEGWGIFPGGVTENFHWPNLFGRTTVLSSTQPLKKISTRNISWGVKATCVWGWQPYQIHVSSVMKSGSFKLQAPSRNVQACSGIALHITCYLHWGRGRCHINGGKAGPRGLILLTTVAVHCDQFRLMSTNKKPFLIKEIYHC
jgi:hypothetical protein